MYIDFTAKYEINSSITLGPENATFAGRGPIDGTRRKRHWNTDELTGYIYRQHNKRSKQALYLREMIANVEKV